MSQSSCPRGAQQAAWRFPGSDYTFSPPLFPISLFPFLSAPFSFSRPCAEETLGGMPDGATVESLHLPIIPVAENQDIPSDPIVGHGEPGVGAETVREASLSAKDKVGTSKGVEQPPKPFLLSEGLPPVPAKLVGRILKGDFVDMAELLRDNLEAQRRGALHETSSTSA